MKNSSAIYYAIAAQDQRFMDAYRRGDVSGLAAFYTDDGQFLPPNSDVVMGKRAIEQAFKVFIDSGNKTLNLQAVEVEGYGDTATEVGEYILKGNDGQMLDRGKFIVIWKKQAGQWKIHRDIINSSMPASL